MNEIIVYIAAGFLGLLAVLGISVFFVLMIASASAAINGFKERLKLYRDIKSTYNRNLANHKRENLKQILDRDCALDDEKTAKKLEKFDKKQKKLNASNEARK
jgi:hypothetical protein